MEEEIDLATGGEPFKRDEKGRLLPGHKGGPGRPKGKTLKQYQADKFRMMSDEEKEEWLKTHNVNGDTIWRMAEGNPANATDITTQGEKILVVPKEFIEDGTHPSSK